MALLKKWCLNRSFYNESNVFSRERLPWKPPDVQRNGGVGAWRIRHHPRLTVQLSMEGGEEQVECSDHHGRPDPQPQESLKNSGQVSDVVR